MATFKAEIRFEVTEIPGENTFDNAAAFLKKVRQLAGDSREIKKGMDHQPAFMLTWLERIPNSDRLGRKRS